MKHRGGKASDLGLEEWVRGSQEKARHFRQRHQNVPLGVDGPISLGWEQFGRTGSQSPEAMAHARCKSCSERRKALAEAKLRGALTSSLFLLFLCPLPDLSPHSSGDRG